MVAVVIWELKAVRNLDIVSYGNLRHLPVRTLIEGSRRKYNPYQKCQASQERLDAKLRKFLSSQHCDGIPRWPESQRATA